MDSSCITVERVQDLQEGRKRVLEDILGRKLAENQQVFITVFTPDLAPSEEARRAAVAGVQETWAKVAQHMEANAVSSDDFDAAVDEAMDLVCSPKTGPGAMRV